MSLVFNESREFRVSKMVLATDHGRYVCRADWRQGDYPLYSLCNVDPIVISEDIHQTFTRLIESWKRRDGHYWYENKGYMLGKDSQNRLVAAVELKESEQSCASFLSFGTSAATAAAVKLIEKNLSPCGYARVSSYTCHTFNEQNFYWDNTPIHGLETTFYLNYQPMGIECFMGDDYKRVYPFKIVNLRGEKISSSEQFGEECVGTVQQGER